MIRVLIENLEFDAIIGLLDVERKNAQKVLINAKFEANDFLDYAKISKQLEEIYQSQKFKTIEESLMYCENHLKKNFNTLKYIYIKTVKPDILPHCCVGAEIEKFY